MSNLAVNRSNPYLYDKNSKKNMNDNLAKDIKGDDFINTDMEKGRIIDPSKEMIRKELEDNLYMHVRDFPIARL